MTRRAKRLRLAAAFAGAISGACICGGPGGNLDPEPAPEPSAAEESPAATDAPAPAVPDDDPPPPVAHRAEQVPELEAELGEDAAFVALTPAADDHGARVFLTVVSMLLAEGAAPTRITNRARELGLMEAATRTSGIVYRVGRLPESVESLARRFLQNVAGQPGLGTWGEDDFEVSALAAWLNRGDARYLRAMIAARETRGWTNYPADRRIPEPWIPWLALPGAAYERLQGMDGVTDAEWSAWCDALDLERFEPLDPESGETSRACGCEEGTPVTWEQERGRWPLTVPGGCLVCEPGQHVVLLHRGTRYAVNGAAGSTPRNRPLDPIWADDPEHEGLKISVGPLIGLGLAQCPR